MKEINKKIIRPKLVGIASILAAGIVITTVTGTMRSATEILHYNAAADKAEYTVMLYMNGSDLEQNYAAAKDDLEEMEIALKDSGLPEEKVRIVVEAGGTEQWQYGYMCGNEYARFCITSDGISDMQPMEARNMGDSDTLSDFLNFATETYPSEHYGIVFWNHGSGQINGFGCDLNYDNDSLTLTELKTAFENADRNTTFDFICFDACLMACVELTDILSVYTDCFVASQDYEPQNGYDYSWLKVFGELDESNASCGKTVGERILSTYSKSYSENMRITLSLIDMSKYEYFRQSLSEFFSTLSTSNSVSYENLFFAVSDNRKAIQGFGRRGNGCESEFADLMNLIDVLKKFSDYDSYNRVKNAFRDITAAQVYKGYTVKPNGLNIYLPISYDFLMYDIRKYKKIEFCTEYSIFADKYADFLSEKNKLNWTELPSEDNSIQIKMDKNDLKNVTGIYLAVFKMTEYENEICLIYTDSDVTVNKNGYIKAKLSDEALGLNGQPLCMMEILNSSQCTEYAAPVLYNGEHCNLIIEFSPENPDGKIIAVMPADTVKQVYEIRVGDIIVPLYPLEQTGKTKRSENSEKIFNDSYYIGEEIPISDIEADICIEKTGIDSKNCLFVFMLQDYRNNFYYTEFAEIN